MIAVPSERDLNLHLVICDGYLADRALSTEASSSPKAIRSLMREFPALHRRPGFCAKDCAAPKAEVMSQFGTGKVDFKAVFAKLKSAGFNGPIMVEGVQVGANAEETTANARANREYLEKALASL